MFTDAAMLPMLTGLADAARAAGAITTEQAKQWAAEQTSRAHNGQMFLALPLFLAAANQP